MVRVRLRRDAFDFGDGNQRHVTQEQKEEGEKQSKCSQVLEDIDPARAVITPIGGEEFALQGRNDDHEALKPHANVDEDGQGENNQHAGADLLEPEELGHDDVAGDHCPEGPPIRGRGGMHERAENERVRRAVVEEQKALIRIAAIPGNEELHGVGVAHNRAGGQGHLAHQLDVPHGDDVFELEQPPQRHQQRQDHAKARIDRPGDEIGREDGGMPAGELRDGKVQGDDGMHREHQGRGKAGQDQIGLLVIAPVPVGAGPAERKKAVTEFPDLRFGAVPHHGQIGNQAHVPKQHRHCKISRNGEHVPHEGRPELRPDAVGIGDGKEPPTVPDAPDVNERENACAHDGEDGHGFGGAIDRGTPALAEKEQDGGNQRSGVADADPPDEIDDGPAPHDRMIEPPDAHAGGHKVKNHGKADGHHGEADAEADFPPCRRLAFDHARDPVGNPAEAAGVGHQRDALQFSRRSLHAQGRLLFHRQAFG